MSIPNKIAEITSILIWKLYHVNGEKDIEITSDPWTKTHTIKIPVTGTDWRDIEYLHELAHAVLAEKHHLLSTAYFKAGTPPENIFQLITPIRIASDWFADHLLMQWVPEEETKEIAEHAEYVLNTVTHDNDVLYAGGLFLAQSAYYLKLKKHDIPKRYRNIADILLSVDPGKPSVNNKRRLINNLSQSNKVKVSKEDDYDVWQLK